MGADSDAFTQINDIRLQFREQNQFTFYTDGSITINDNQKANGIGWMEVNSPMKLRFTTNIRDPYADSTFIELYGILTTLIATPAFCTIDIYTDSDTVISERLEQ